MFWEIVGALLFVGIVIPIIFTLVVGAYELSKEWGCSWLFWFLFLVVLLCIIL